MDWECGDLALCVVDANQDRNLKEFPSKGQLFTVEAYIPTFIYVPYLNPIPVLIFRDGPFNLCRNDVGDVVNKARLWPAAFFVKVTPEQLDEEDMDVVEALKKSQPQYITTQVNYNFGTGWPGDWTLGGRR